MLATFNLHDENKLCTYVSGNAYQ